MHKIKKVALLGPESSGKTEICRRLAAHFHTEWVPEFARDYLGEKNNQYSFEDVLSCMKSQMASEDEMEKQAHDFLFCDNELINFKVWFSDVFKKIPEGLEEQIQSHRYDLILLAYPDVPFVEDTLRVNPHRREFFFDWYKRELENYKMKYVIIKGLGEKRFEAALNAIAEAFN
jgi:NadR type nicotinamide-nucleotide adenylyltransferase